MSGETVKVVTQVVNKIIVTIEPPKTVKIVTPGTQGAKGDTGLQGAPGISDGGTGLPSGGNQGDVLTKNSSGDSDASFLPPARPTDQELFFAYFDEDGVLRSAPGFRFNEFYGMDSTQILDVEAEADYLNMNNRYVQLNPIEDSPARTNVHTSFGLDIDPANAGFSMGADGLTARIIDSYMHVNGSGHHGDMNSINSVMVLGQDTGDDPRIPGSIKNGTLIDTYVEVREQYSVENLNLIRANAKINADSIVSSGINVYSANVELHGELAQYLNMFLASGTIKPSNTYENSVCIFQTQMGFDGSIDNVFAFNDNNQIKASAHITGIYKSASLSPSLEAGAEVDYLRGITISLGGEDYTLHGYCGLEINTSGIIMADGSIPQAIDSRGLHNFQTYFEAPNNFSGFLSFFNAGSLLKINEGSPLSNTLAFINQFSANVQFNDDVGPDPYGLGVGIVQSGFVSQLAGAPGKTLDTLNVVLAGASVPPDSTGGVIDRMNLFGALGVVPFGGTLTINELNGLYVGQAAGMLAVDLFGVHIDNDSAENYFAKSVNIGTSTKKTSNDDIAFEVGSKKAILLPGLTTAERDGLTPIERMLIYNTDSKVMEVYNGTSWI